MAGIVQRPVESVRRRHSAATEGAVRQRRAANVYIQLRRRELTVRDRDGLFHRDVAARFTIEINCPQFATRLVRPAKRAKRGVADPEGQGTARVIGPLKVAL